ncbi:MAG: lipid-A-disaccharide synthase [Candidatus Latescibacteria bacterium]|nr:lipid-A-disaccharide synthase [Candidatus Latescibacterota bacterium]
MKVLISAGDRSGDYYGAQLVRKMRQSARDLEIVGLGGRHMSLAGVDLLASSDENRLMGLTELSGGLGSMVRVWKKMTYALGSCDLLITIDYPEFNMRLARKAKKQKLPVLGYLPPQVWAWRPWRAKAVARIVDDLVVAFEWEREIYRPFMPTDRIHWVGHPLLDDQIEPTAPTGDGAVLALLPGSRRFEIERLLPPMLAAVELSKNEWRPVIAASDETAKSWCQPIVEESGCDISVEVGKMQKILENAQAALVCSGTATLEVALAGVPQVILYRVSSLTGLVVGALMNSKHIGLPNIVLGRREYPELVQRQVSPINIATALEEVTSNGLSYASSLSDEIAIKLGEPGAAQRAAELAMSLCNHHSRFR